MKELWLGFLLLGLTAVDTARAGVIETSVMGSYSRSRPAAGYDSLKRSYSGSIDLKFTAVSAIQFEYSDTYARGTYPTNLGNLLSYDVTATSSADDQIYSVNWVQNLVPSKLMIQPYFKFGVGRWLHKEWFEVLGLVQSGSQHYVSGVAGLGLRIFLTRNMALKGEFVTYVPDVRFSKWKENQNFSSGISWAF